MADKDDTIELRVSKAIPSDVGFGRARISSEMGLDLKPGDFVDQRRRAFHCRHLLAKST